MAHRSAEFSEKCDRCDAPATSACLRCLRPACREHAPRQDQRCESCESHYLAKSERYFLEALHDQPSAKISDIAGAAGVLCIAVFLFSAITAMGTKWMVLEGLLAFVFLTLALLWSRTKSDANHERRIRYHARQRFMQERPDSKRLNERRTGPPLLSDGRAPDES